MQRYNLFVRKKECALKFSHSLFCKTFSLICERIRTFIFALKLKTILNKTRNKRYSSFRLCFVKIQISTKISDNQEHDRFSQNEMLV